MNKKEFESKLGEIFEIKLENEQTIELKLTTVDSLNKAESPHNLRKDPFSLVFIGPKEIRLPDNSYWMSVEGHDKQLIFISGFKKDNEGIHYDSIFN